MRVLLAEDNELNMEIAETFLTDAGVQITKAYNGKEEVERYLEQPAGTFDAILTDLMMPIMDGCEAARAGLDRLYLIGEMSSHVKRGAMRFGMKENSIFTAATHSDAAKAVRKNYVPGEALLIKGSRAATMEKAVSYLKNEFT